MSIECGICERDLRRGHDKGCPRHPKKKAKHRADFEKWVNNPHKTGKSNEPGREHEYTDPWTAGAWSAWQHLHSILPKA
jgi:hypothetical protein